MKKIILLVISITVLLASITNSFTMASAASSSATGVIKDVKHLSKTDREEITVSLSSYISYSSFTLSGPDRIVIDITGVDAPGKQQIKSIGSKMVKAIRYAQFDKGIARVVLDVNGKQGYHIEKVNGDLLIYVYTPGSFTPGNIADTGVDAGVDKGSVSGGSKDEDPGLPSRSQADVRKISVTKDFSIEYLSDGSSDEVAICVKNYKNYNVMRLTGPDRIVVDIPGAKVSKSQKTVDINSGMVKSIRYAQFNSKTARMVLDITGQAQYSVSEQEGRLVLNLENYVHNSNLIYHNSGDRVYFTLQGAKLTEGGEKLTKFYTESYDSSGKVYTLTFPSELMELKEGLLNINDGYLSSVRIVKNKENNTTSIIFTGKDRFVYLVMARPEVNNTNITVLKPATKNEKLVVIDAGHGGKEPGAIYGSLYEKDLNLDIARRLNELLKKEKIKTYMIREDDSYVALYERAYIANNLNAALFLSIHNNAIGDPNFGGTMTLYYPQWAGSGSFNGKVFAQIVQSELLSKLKTTDRKIVERPNLVVLKATTMPATLAEIAFMTNANDRNNLQKESFRQKAAQALCDAIVKASKQIR